MKRALITGGSGAIGKALVKEFSSDYEVIFTRFKNNEAQSGATGIKCDITDREAVLKIADEYPHFDLLINNAGISQVKLFTDLKPEDWQRMLAVNLTGAFNVTQAVLPAMIRRKSGVVINISSIWGEIGASCEVHYSAAKAGLIGFSKALAKEVEPSGIRVHYIAPGAVESPMNAGFSEEEMLDACTFNKGGKILTPEDIAKEVRCLTEAL
ncbi:MAG: SDR family NAD(P)-dependent oxidoreductase [Oscillospiraceae bacterium]|jgi:3-oxoacyl-[acyl-carrier protein] reductase|nr:SDR family NAD(P)-dependent oxidoreductase [Oscillospiraceae bacterium]